MPAPPEHSAPHRLRAGTLIFGPTRLLKLRNLQCHRMLLTEGMEQVTQQLEQALPQYFFRAELIYASEERE